MATFNLFDNQNVGASLSYLAADGVTLVALPAGIIPSWSLADPDATLANFLQETYEAAANGASWDRAALERPPSPWPA